MKKTFLKQAWILTLVLAVVLSASAAMAQDAKEKAKPAETKTESGFEAAKPAAGDSADKAKGDKAQTGEDAKEAAGKEGEPTCEDKPGSIFGGNYFIYIMLGMLVLMFVFSSRGKKKQQRKRQELLDAVKKGSKVVTIGGIVGTVVEVRDDEILVKVDDGTRMKFARWAIRTVGDDAQTDKKDNCQQQR